MVGIFKDAGAEQAPTLAEAEWSLKNLGTGVMVGGQKKHWCGVFAAEVLRRAGVDARWTLLGGGIKGSGVSLRSGNQNMLPGDVAMIPKSNHHFIVTDVDYTGNKLWTVEGNTGNQYIREMTRQFKYPKDPKASEKTIYGYYRIL
ncbi:MAG: hypothetical protein ACREMA_10030 [Longimicrobiales bacterium]